MALARRRSDKSFVPAIFDGGTIPCDRPLPSPPSPKGVSFPNAEVCQLLEKRWASLCSRGLSLPERRDYADHVTVREQDILSPHDSTLEKCSIRDTSSFSNEAEAVTSGTFEISARPILALQPPTWQLQFFIRADLGGDFHTYPHLDGPFQSLQEAENAIARHLDELRSPKMCTDGLSRSEICIRNTLYWPDGTRKKSSKSCPKRRNVGLLVHALLDKYNEDYQLLGDLAYELEEVVSFGEIYDRESFYHINLTIKNKRADGDHSGDGNLFFAEVTRLNGENVEYVLNCFCVVQPNDKGRCYGCEYNGSVDLKHPTNARKYKGGHYSSYPQCRGLNRPLGSFARSRAYVDEEARLAAEESRIRHIYKCLDDPVFVAKLDAARTAPADSSKREGGQGKGLMKYAELDVPRRVVPADSSKREDSQGKGLIKYVVPAKRLVHSKLDGATRPAPADSSKGEDGQGKGQIKYVVPAKQL